jgi:hypothetical protein
LVDFVVCIQVASFWFAVFGLVGILDRMALGEVGFNGVAVWLGGCILGRAGENEVVVVEVVGLDGAEVGLAGAEAVSHTVRVGNSGRLGWRPGIHPFA